MPDKEHHRWGIPQVMCRPRTCPLEYGMQRRAAAGRWSHIFIVVSFLFFWSAPARFGGTRLPVSRQESPCCRRRSLCGGLAVGLNAFLIQSKFQNFGNCPWHWIRYLVPPGYCRRTRRPERSWSVTSGFFLAPYERPISRRRDCLEVAVDYRSYRSRW